MKAAKARNTGAIFLLVSALGWGELVANQGGQGLRLRKTAWVIQQSRLSALWV